MGLCADVGLTATWASLITFEIYKNLYDHFRAVVLGTTGPCARFNPKTEGVLFRHIDNMRKFVEADELLSL